MDIYNKIQTLISPLGFSGPSHSTRTVTGLIGRAITLRGGVPGAVNKYFYITLFLQVYNMNHIQLLYISCMLINDFLTFTVQVLLVMGNLFLWLHGSAKSRTSHEFQN